MNHQFRKYCFEENKFYYFNIDDNFNFNSNVTWGPAQLCTGSVDIDNELIYEGDVVEFFYQSNREFEKSYNKKVPENRWTFVITFECGCLGVVPFDKKQHNPVDWNFAPIYNKHEGCFLDSKDAKIVGNIFNKSLDFNQK
jgi:hypothetical protein